MGWPWSRPEVDEVAAARQLARQLVEPLLALAKALQQMEGIAQLAEHYPPSAPLPPQLPLRYSRQGWSYQINYRALPHRPTQGIRTQMIARIREGAAQIGVEPAPDGSLYASLYLDRTLIQDGSTPREQRLLAEYDLCLVELRATLEAQLEAARRQQQQLERERRERARRRAAEAELAADELLASQGQDRL